MLFDQTFRKELGRVFGVTLVVLLTIVLTMALIRTFNMAAGGEAAPQDVVLLLGYTMLSYLPIMLSLALFIAVVSTLGRLYRDSEMAVWHACGLPLRHFVGPVMRTAWPVLLAIFALVFFVWPWANGQTLQLRERYEKRSDLSRIAPGQFQSSRDGSKVFFIDRDASQANIGRNVFILSQQGLRESVTTAAEGQVLWDGDDRLLALRAGQRAESDERNGSHTLARFDEYRVIADRQAVRAIDELPPKAMDTAALWRSPLARHRGELAWRVGMVIGAANFALLAIGLSTSNPRRPNNWSLMLALLAFVVYFQLIGLSQAWVAREQLGLAQGVLAVHAPMTLLAALLLLWRDESIRWHWPWRRAQGAA